MGGAFHRFIREYLYLILIFLVVFGFRLYFAFSTDNFSNDAYFAIRQVRSIMQTGKPIMEDALSYSGRTNIFLPAYYYIIAAGNLILGETVSGKVLPNLLASSLVFVIFFLAREITRSREASLLAAFVSGFLPSYIKETLLTLSPQSIALPLTFLLLYLFILILKNRKHAVWYVIVLVAFSLIHQSAYLLPLGILFYFVLAGMEKMKLSGEEIELLLFTLFFITWLNFIFMKKLLLMHGVDIIWQNVPKAIAEQVFAEFNIIHALPQIGLVPVLFGIFAIYRYLFVEKKRTLLMFFGFALSIFTLVMLRLIRLELGVVYLGATLTLLFAQTYKILIVYISKTKFSERKNLILYFLVAVIVISSVIPSIVTASGSAAQTPGSKEIAAMEWLRENTPEGSVVLSTIEEGHLISGIASRRNVADTNFIFVKDVDSIVSDIRIMFTTQFETEAVPLLLRYDVSYIYFHDAKAEYGIENIPYLEEGCFEKVYNDSAVVYKVLCKWMEESK